MEYEYKEIDYEKLLELRKTTREIFDKIKTTADIKKTRDKLKSLRTHLKFCRIFNSDTVQGTAGIVQLKNLPENNIVFKVSNGVDYAIEHETSVLQDLEEIEEFCPHFMSKIQNIELPISALFFTEPCKEQGFMEDSNDYFITQVLFTEYVSRYSFYHFLKTENKNVINSLILQILCGISFAQKHCNLTHYDLHLDNVLVRQCDKNTLHIYKTDDNTTLLLPTHGNVPVIIDMGSSYSKSSKKLLTSIEHYHHGLQPSIFDKMNDLHHFLLSSLSCLIEETNTEYYNNIYYNVLCMFSPIPLYRNKGWKILDYSLVHELEDYLMEKIYEHSKSADTFYDYFRDMIEIINGIVDLPFKELSMEEVDAKLPKLWQEFWKHLEKLIKFESVTNDTECVYVLKEIIGIYVSMKEGKPLNKCIEQAKNKLAMILDPSDMREIQFKEMIGILSELSDYLGAYYNIYLKKNMKVVDGAYEVMKDGFGLVDVNDLIRFLYKIMPSNLLVNSEENYTVYYFDGVNKERKKEIIRFTEKESSKFNDMTMKKRCDYLLNKMV